MFINYRKGFSLLELIVAIAAISIISTFIYRTYIDMQEIDRKSSMVKEMDSIKTKMNERLKNIDILEGTLVSSEKIYNDTEEVFNKNEFVRLDDTDLKSNFWGISSNQYKKYIFAQSKTFATANGKIPYTDFYVIMLGPKLDRVFKDNPEYMENELFLIQPENSIIQRFNKKYKNGVANKGDATSFDSTDDGYPNIQAYGISELEFRKEIKNVIVFKISTQDIVLQKYNESLEIIKNYAKNLKDWGSIQMSMYENIIAKYGGSYNIDYFVSIGLSSTNKIGGFSNETKSNFDKEMLYSSIALDSTDNPIRESSGTEQGFKDIDIDNLTNTNYGIVICDSSCVDTPVNNSSIISMYDMVSKIDKLPKDGNVNINNAISLDSEQLLGGSKLIFGIGNVNNKVHNAFGEKYKIYLTNVKEWKVEWTDVEGASTKNIDFTQNVPLINSYAPYSATIFTTFPWLIDNTKTNITDGYLDIKVFPELR